MLKVPEVKFPYSANQSNVDTNAMCDWLEACALFDGPGVTKSEVVDLLLEYRVCADESQDLAHQIADEGWDEIIKRKRWGGIPGYVAVTGSRIYSPMKWHDDPIRSFLLLLSLLRLYPDWAKGYQDYSVQGDLFERIVEAICPHLLPGWITYRVGWSPNNTKNIPGIISELSGRLFVPGAADPDRWLLNAGNDGGLDIVCYRDFEDDREAMPLFFLQCASGRNWREKISTPNPDLWQKLLDSAVRPSTGIVAPFVVEAKEFSIAALVGQIIVFDRVRLLKAAQEGDVLLDATFSAEIVSWMQSRIDGLPRVD